MCGVSVCLCACGLSVVCVWYVPGAYVMSCIRVFVYLWFVCSLAMVLLVRASCVSVCVRCVSWLVALKVKHS